jgi:hypothetical protein
MLEFTSVLKLARVWYFLVPSVTAQKNFNSGCYGHTASTTTTAPYQNKAIQRSEEIESDIELYDE